MSGSRKAIWAVVGAVVVVSTIAGAGGMAMSLYANHRQKAQVEQTTTGAAAPKSDLARFAVGSLAALSTPAEAKSAPEYAFRDRTGTAVRFSAFQGKVVVVNLWAMWCAPCKAEMPSLDAAAAALGDRAKVIAVSQDLDGRVKVDPYFAERRFARLQPYTDPKLGLSLAYGANLPTTILYDADGRELWRVTGGLDWTGAKAKALLAEIG